MSAKTEAITRAKAILVDKQQELHHKLSDNRWTMKKLINENTIHKRELVVLNELIRNLDNKPPKGTKT